MSAVAFGQLAFGQHLNLGYTAITYNTLNNYVLLQRARWKSSKVTLKQRTRDSGAFAYPCFVEYLVEPSQLFNEIVS